MRKIAGLYQRSSFRRRFRKCPDHEWGDFSKKCYFPEIMSEIDRYDEFLGLFFREKLFFYWFFRKIFDFFLEDAVFCAFLSCRIFIFVRRKDAVRHPGGSVRVLRYSEFIIRSDPMSLLRFKMVEAAIDHKAVEVKVPREVLPSISVRRYSAARPCAGISTRRFMPNCSIRCSGGRR